MRFPGIISLVLLFLLVAVTAQARVERVYHGKLNVNTASAADFTRLPGVGEVIGFRIVKERERRGKFLDTKELKEVKGISARVFEGFRNHVALQGDSNLKVYTDLNTITKPLLLGLPGMSEGEARSILNFRKARGHFEKVEDLLQVPGIDRKRFAELSEWLTVAGKAGGK
ncbi:MAG: helix-hairpin-helix domain-containing protein [Geobacteraceae bacterium]|nr:helix-hairpin-helix domain-containing protein [Geobacteraceae bacterium]